MEKDEYSLKDELLYHGMETLVEAVKNQNYENGIFLFHAFCDCFDPQCKWCEETACGCEITPLRFFIDEEEVSTDEQYQRYMEFVNPPGKNRPEEKEKLIAEAKTRFKILFPRRHHTCFPLGLMENREANYDVLPLQVAPNLWHKKSGFKLWLKEDVFIYNDVEIGVESIINECLQSLPVKKLRKKMKLN